MARTPPPVRPREAVTTVTAMYGDVATAEDNPTHAGPVHAGAPCDRGADHRVVPMSGARSGGVALRAELLADLCEEASRVALLAEGSAAQAAAHQHAERLNALLRSYLADQAAHTAPVPFTYRPPRRPRS
jgi:hypothetical protein